VVRGQTKSRWVCNTKARKAKLWGWGSGRLLCSENCFTGSDVYLYRLWSFPLEYFIYNVSYIDREEKSGTSISVWLTFQMIVTILFAHQLSKQEESIFVANWVRCMRLLISFDNDAYVSTCRLDPLNRIMIPVSSGSLEQDNDSCSVLQYLQLWGIQTTLPCKNNLFLC
jgi:hypothetical protein